METVNVNFAGQAGKTNRGVKRLFRCQSLPYRWYQDWIFPVWCWRRVRGWKVKKTLRQDYSEGEISRICEVSTQSWAGELTQRNKHAKTSSHTQTHMLASAVNWSWYLKKKKLEDSSKKLAWRCDSESVRETMSICHFTSSLSDNADMSNPTACFTQWEGLSEAGWQLKKKVGVKWCTNTERH